MRCFILSSRLLVGFCLVARVGYNVSRRMVSMAFCEILLVYLGGYQDIIGGC